VVFVFNDKDNEGGSESVSAGVKTRNGTKRPHQGRMLMIDCGGPKQIDMSRQSFAATVEQAFGLIHCSESNVASSAGQ